MLGTNYYSAPYIGLCQIKGSPKMGGFHLFLSKGTAAHVKKTHTTPPMATPHQTPTAVSSQAVLPEPKGPGAFSAPRLATSQCKSDSETLKMSGCPFGFNRHVNQPLKKREMAPTQKQAPKRATHKWSKQRPPSSGSRG